MGAGKELADSAVLRNPESGEVVILAGGTPLPTWAEGLVDDYLLAPAGTAANADAAARREAAEAKARRRRHALAQAAAEQEADVAGEEAGLYDDDPDDGAGEDGAGGLTAPPRAGRGSGLEAWTAYAEGLGLEIPDGATRDDLIDLVDERGES